MENETILIQIKEQLNRLVSDAESEKITRKERNREVDARIDKVSGRVHVLEDDKIKKDLLIWGMLLIGGVLGSLITLGIEKLLK